MKSAGRKAKSAVWNKGPISIDLRTVGVELEVSTCFLTDGVWSVGSVYDASALNHLLSTARLGAGLDVLAAPEAVRGAASLSDRRDYDRIDSERGRVSKAATPLPPPSGPPGCPLQLRPVREHWFDDVATEA